MQKPNIKVTFARFSIFSRKLIEALPPESREIETVRTCMHSVINKRCSVEHILPAYIHAISKYLSPRFTAEDIICVKEGGDDSLVIYDQALRTIKLNKLNREWFEIQGMDPDADY